MIGDRTSLLVKIGRIYQHIPPVFLNWLEKPFSTFLADVEPPRMIILISSPRSGSTLTYQVMTHSLQCLYLSNVWNLLYATPMLGGLLSGRLCASYRSDFQSVHGFVRGLCGPAEGMRFWEYWLGQTLAEENNTHDPSQAKVLVCVLGYLNKVYQKPFIAGYLGHAFSIDLLQQYFPRTIFVYLQRELLSTSYSIFKIRQNSKGHWFSLMPKGCNGIQNERLSLHEEVARQVFFVHKSIQTQLKNTNCFHTTYADLCANPRMFLRDLIKFSTKSGLALRYRNDFRLPMTFPPRLVDRDTNLDTIKISGILSKLEKEFGSVTNFCTDSAQ